MRPKIPAEVLCKALKCSAVECVPLTEDGSNRQYFRIIPTNRDSFILMQVNGQDAMDLQAGRYSWLVIGSLLLEEQVLVPRVHSIHSEFDSILIQDFGDKTLDLRVAELDSSEISSLYRSATSVLNTFLSIKPKNPSPWSQRGFDFALLRREMEFFKNQFLSEIPEFQNEKDQNLLSLDFDSLCQFIGKFPQYFTHRDYHSRNLLYHKSQIGVIDFQDARWGPAAYDLCSLAFDPYASLNLQTRRLIFQNALDDLDTCFGKTLRSEVEESWRAVALQRFLKAIGSFAFLTKKGKRNYLSYITPTLASLSELMANETPWAYLVDNLIPRLLVKPSYEKTP